MYKRQGHLLCASCAAKAGKNCNLDQAALFALRHICLVEDKKIFAFKISVGSCLLYTSRCVYEIANAVPVLPGAEKAADAFLYTAAGQRNRNHTGPFVRRCV